MNKIFRAKAPLRIGLAGGGTDVSPYSEIYGGSILNATVSMYAYAVIKPLAGNKIILKSIDKNIRIEADNSGPLEINGQLDLLKGVYNNILKYYIKEPVSFELSTYVDAPAGSGLGTSSTLVVAILSAFSEWLKLPLGEYDMAHLAWEIERKDLNMAGGKQDQYAATFGGFNFMEFFNNDRVIVNPLRIKQEYLNELEFNFVLYYTGTSRLSSKIITAQSNNIVQKKEKSIEAMHKLKEQSILMKEAILKGQFNELGKIMDFGWKFKKQTASEVTSPMIDEIYETAIKAGSTGGKISGAGGGGFLMFYCPNNTRYNVIKNLHRFGGEFRRFQFINHGVQCWSAHNDK